MTMKKKKQLLCEDNLRHNEYYGMQNTIDNLYQASLNGEVFTDLMSVILQRENILLAYRNIKKNTGSKTNGTDNLTIEDIGRCSPDEVVEKVRFIINGSEHGYRPKPVRRKEIPKPYDPSKMRPLGIPCIWDRLVQQCIKQVLEPVCEAKFSKNSYGFRPNHSVENAIARSYQLLQHANLHYVIEFDIKGFFDNVNHAKLIRQIWAMGIHDKQLIFVIRRILKAPINIGVVPPFVFSVAPHNAFPSIARWVFFVSTISPIHSIKAYRANSSSMPLSIRVMVEGKAIPYFNFICFRNSSKWVLHHLRLRRIVVRPQRNPRVTHTSISARSCLFSLPHR